MFLGEFHFEEAVSDGECVDGLEVQQFFEVEGEVSFEEGLVAVVAVAAAGLFVEDPVGFGLDAEDVEEADGWAEVEAAHFTAVGVVEGVAGAGWGFGLADDVGELPVDAAVEGEFLDEGVVRVFVEEAGAAGDGIEEIAGVVCRGGGC